MAGWRVATLALLVGLIGLAGCNGGKSVYVTQFPRWDYERYERIAVVPARPADPRAARDARLLSDRLTTLISQSSAFTVLSRGEMEEVFQEQDLSRLADAIDEGTALPEGRLKVAQALVVAKISSYDLVKNRKKQTIPRYRLDRRGRIMLDRHGRPIKIGEDVVYTYTHGADVEASVRVVDAATGKILLSDSAQASLRKSKHGRPPSDSPEAMASDATRELAMKLGKKVAPTRVKVKLKSKMLLLATAYFDGEYEQIKKLSRALGQFLLVVRDLPEECEGNNFRLAIAEEEGRQNLFEEEFTWSSNAGPEGISYQVPMESIAQSGAERFVVKLYSAGDPEPKLKREFRLETGD